MQTDERSRRGGQRFGPADRVRSGRDFRRLSRGQRRRRAAHLVVVEGPSFGVEPAGSDTPGPRLGLTVSRKVGNAVARNRVKRRVREWFRRERGHLTPGRDYVVIARPGAAELDARALWSELAEATGR